ncbi:hypothetical protein [Nitrosopumilus sp.]|uniref:hypothetical protein n=1 Tax=Nitrosopumilus sp. TaxID=2024843 RepID=UPI00292DD918|nr:hypothetical protein [Nitrosopumilus sp.]
MNPWRFIAKLAVALVAVIIVATIVPDVLGLNIAELCVEDSTLLGGVTGNHCGDDSVFLTNAVKTIVGDGYSMLLVLIGLAFIGFGAYEGVQYRLLMNLVSSPEETNQTIKQRQ